MHSSMPVKAVHALMSARQLYMQKVLLVMQATTKGFCRVVWDQVGSQFLPVALLQQSQQNAWPHKGMGAVRWHRHYTVMSLAMLRKHPRCRHTTILLASHEVLTQVCQGLLAYLIGWTEGQPACWPPRLA